MNYLSFAVPALAAGIAASHYGLRATALVYAAGTAALVAAATGAVLLHRNTGPGKTFDAPPPRTHP
ncbi:hypothetical protein GA0070624_4075 [Micromonospora rhizosphaerae]|uniref:Uncharacterized protein n=1 Tax=Micromonospora rhizosphaerae TaxID=568872 RepID=A0A1C6SLL6_9ACTN|nr:hypothetical protein [Micromonospora rhizosphaerae]SCL30446.1 hypothetical protein GA0070624_4075 [Micromonospora rhizosphaerae]